MREGSGARGDWGLLEKQKKWGGEGAESAAEEASKRGGETSLGF